MLANDQRKKSGVGATDHRLAGRQRHEVAARDERGEPRRFARARRCTMPSAGAWRSLTRRHTSSGSPGFDARRGLAELLLHLVELAQPDLEQAARAGSRGPLRGGAWRRTGRRRAGTTRAPSARGPSRGSRCRTSARRWPRVCASARSPSSPRSSTSANARGRSASMKRSVPRSVSRPFFTKIPGGSLMLSRADWMKRGVWRSFESTRRARSARGRVVEQRLPGEARAEQLAVHLRVALPRADLLELVQPPLDVRRDPSAARRARRRVSESVLMAASRRARPASDWTSRLDRRRGRSSRAGRRSRWTPSKVAAEGFVSYRNDR